MCKLVDGNALCECALGGKEAVCCAVCGKPGAMLPIDDDGAAYCAAHFPNEYAALELTLETLGLLRLYKSLPEEDKARFRAFLRRLRDEPS